MNELADKDLTGEVISAAIAVHKTLGPGFLECVYEEALAIELGMRGIPFERQKIVNIEYRGSVVGQHRLDLLIDAKVVVELKAVKELDAIFFAQVRSYMKAMHVETGLLLNFASFPLQIKRVGREQACRSD